jgi:(S)-3,5-dihydroxyphenylglycine transaminase
VALVGGRGGSSIAGTGRPIPGGPTPEGHSVATNPLTKQMLHPSVSDPVLDTMNFLNEITHRFPEAISFAPGRPFDGFFEVEQIFTYMRRYLRHLEDQGASPAEVRDALFQYGPTAGRIRELIADSVRKDENIDVSAEAVVVTVGCQEAMFLALRAVIASPDDALLYSSPSYVGIIGAARLLGCDPVPVQERADGFHCADLERALAAERNRGRRPRVFYVIPDHANPSGNTMSLAERHALLELSARADFLILEDSPYRLVSPGEQLPTLKSLDRDQRVIHLGSFSKTLFPGARVGYAIADQRVVGADGKESLLADELTKIKSMITVNTSPLSQAAVAGMLLAADGRTAEFNSKNAVHYGDSMQAVLRELTATFPDGERGSAGVRWNRPAGGFFLTLDVPFDAGNSALVRSAEQYEVIWTPMSYFSPPGEGERSMRLSVSYLSPEETVEGVSRLARFIRSESS